MKVSGTIQWQTAWRPGRSMHGSPWRERPCRCRFLRGENGGIAPRHLPREVERALHGGAPAAEAEFVVPAVRERLPVPPPAAPGPARVRDPLQDQLDLGGRERLGEIIRCSTLHGFHGAVDRAVRGDNDNAGPRALGEEFGDQIQPQPCPQPQVHKRHVKWLASRLRDRILRVAHRDHGMPVNFEAHCQRFADVDLVIDDEHVQGDFTGGLWH